MTTSVSAYIPCYNNEKTIRQAIQSIQNQTVPVAEIFVVDDHSSDNSVALAQASGVQVIANADNEGRGSVRAKAMVQARHELVLSCDATMAMSEDFVERCLPWFDQGSVAGVHGRVTQSTSKGVADRWRARHLFKVNATPQVSSNSLLISGGAMVRKSVVLKEGNYDPNLRALEDRELGSRLLTAGYNVILDPQLLITATDTNNLWQVLERYSRWYANQERSINWREYLKLIYYSMKVMCAEDIAAKDIASIPVSLLCPHFQYWHSKFWQPSQRLGSKQQTNQSLQRNR